MSVGDNLWVTLLPTFGTRNPKGLTILRGGGFKNTPLESKFCYSNNQSIWGLGFVHSFFGTSFLVKKIQIWWFVMNCFRAWRISSSSIPITHDLSWIVLGLEEFIIIYPNYPWLVMNCFLGFEEFIIIYPEFTNNLSWTVLGLEEFIIIIIYPATRDNVSWVVLGLKEFIIIYPTFTNDLPPGVVSRPSSWMNEWMNEWMVDW